MAEFAGLNLPKRKTIKRWGRRKRKGKLRWDGLADPPTMEDLTDANVKRLVRLLGDEHLAQRVAALLQKWPRGTVPELVVYDWLEQKKIPFAYQGEFGGGRSIHGGAVPDFVVNVGGRGLVLRVQGEYWHTLPGQEDRDLAQKLLMMGQYVEGLRVYAVVDVWENDLYQRMDLTMRMALAGIGLRE